MTKAIQTKKGYLRGVRGILLTVLNADGSMPETPDKYWIDTAQEAGIEATVTEGESAELRGGDRLLTTVEDEDIVTGAVLTFKDARFDANATVALGGGTLITSGSGISEEIIGWIAPTIAEQATKIPVQAEVYVQSFNAAGGREAYMKYKFVYGKGSLGSISHADKEWGTPEFTLKCSENPSTGLSTYRKEFVTTLPDESVPSFNVYIGAVTGGGSATVTSDATDDLAKAGDTVTVTIADLATTFVSITVTDHNANVISTTEVLAETTYTFVMPAANVEVVVDVSA